MEESITSPLSKNLVKNLVLEKKITDLLNEEKVEGAFIFWIPEEKEEDVVMFDLGLCGHQLEALSEAIKVASEKRLEEDPECKN